MFQNLSKHFLETFKLYIYALQSKNVQTQTVEHTSDDSKCKWYMYSHQEKVYKHTDEHISDDIKCKYKSILYTKIS